VQVEKLYLVISIRPELHRQILQCPRLPGSRFTQYESDATIDFGDIRQKSSLVVDLSKS